MNTITITMQNTILQSRI